MKDTHSILIVDDDDRFRERLEKAFVARGYDVRCATKSAEALKLANEESPELALVDLRLGGEWGLKVLRELLAVDAETRVVMLTAYGSIATALDAVRLGAVNFLQKPAGVDEIELAFWPKEAGSAPDVPGDVPSLARAEWEHINRVLAECDGNIRQAARLLKLHRRTLQRKLAKYPVRD